MMVLFILLAGKESLGQDKQENFIEKVKWLVGSWRGHHNGSPFYEAWRIDKNSLVNYTIEIRTSDTTVIEQTALREKNGKIVFGKKGDWLLKRLTRNEVVLENDSAKYSNRIIYLHMDNDHWFTILESPGYTMYFDMERLPPLEAMDRLIKTKKKMD